MTPTPHRRRGRFPQRPPAPATPVAGERVPCTCAATPAGRPGPVCPSCTAWEHGTGLLTAGTTVAKTRWIQAHIVAEEDTR